MGIGTTNGTGKTGYYAKQAYDMAAAAMAAVESAPALVPATASQNGYMTKEYAAKLDKLNGIHIGTIFPYAGTSQPPGALLCDGAAVSRTMYPDLFDEIGTTYGAGDGSTTFNLPNLVDKFIEGDITSGTAKAAGLPNIEGEMGMVRLSNTNSIQQAPISGALGFASTTATTYSATYNSAQASIAKTTFDASQSNPIYGNSDTVQPPALTMRYYIQAFTDSTDPALVDLTQIVQDLAHRLTREQTPAFNKRDEITTSGTYTAPVTGWYRITVKGGGGGGWGGRHSSSIALGGRGGGEGGTTIGFERMTAGQTASVVIGAGGAGGAGNNSSVSASTSGDAGGRSTVTVNNNEYAGGGGASGPGGSGTIYGAPGTIGGGEATGTTSSSAGSGGGNGGALSSGRAGVQGGGGAGGSSQISAGSDNGGAGGDGFVWFEYFDPTI